MNKNLVTFLITILSAVVVAVGLSTLVIKNGFYILNLSRDNVLDVINLLIPTLASIFTFVKVQKGKNKIYLVILTFVISAFLIFILTEMILGILMMG